jgi:hypothetical protein
VVDAGATDLDDLLAHHAALDELVPDLSAERGDVAAVPGSQLVSPRRPTQADCRRAQSDSNVAVRRSRSVREFEPRHRTPREPKLPRIRTDHQEGHRHQLGPVRVTAP